MRGRKPKPTAMKLVTGNPGRRPLNASEPRPGTEMPVCPSWIDDAAKEQWNALAPELHRIGTLTTVDAIKFATLCQAVADLRAALETIREQGADITTDKGNVISHPAVGRKNRAMLIIAKYGSDFGLDPAARSRVTATAPPEADPLAQFLGARQSA